MHDVQAALPASTPHGSFDVVGWVQSQLRPAKQLSQIVEPTSSEYLPASQASQGLGIPPLSPKYPVSHTQSWSWGPLSTPLSSLKLGIRELDGQMVNTKGLAASIGVAPTLDGEQSESWFAGHTQIVTLNTPGSPNVKLNENIPVLEPGSM